MRMRQIKCMNATNVLLRGKFMPSNACISKKESLTVSTLSFYPDRLGKKDEQINPQLTRKI